MERNSKSNYRSSSQNTRASVIAEPRKEPVSFKSIYSSKGMICISIIDEFLDFMIAEEIIQSAEKLKLKRLKKEGNSDQLQAKLMMTLTLSDVLQGYQKVMAKQGIANDNHYYAMIVKLSLNQRGKTWRECLYIEKIVTHSNIFNLLEKQKAHIGTQLSKKEDHQEHVLQVD